MDTLAGGIHLVTPKALIKNLNFSGYPLTRIFDTRTSHIIAPLGKLDRDALHYGKILFKDNFLQHIATSCRFLELMSTAKCGKDNSPSGDHLY